MFRKKGFLTFLILFSVLMLSLSGCSKPEAGSEGPVPIADNLYEITYTQDFDWSRSEALNLSGFGSSAVQNGPFRGRNYDWFYSDTDICVVHASVSPNRPHASVGIADMSYIVKEDGSYNYSMLPFVTVDGINDAGVCIQVNVMPYGENGMIFHTEKKEDDLAGNNVVRFVLDYADSVESALALLSKKDIISELGLIEELHWMISGPATEDDKRIETVVLEVFPDGQHITREFIDGKPIMTNFNVSNFDGTPASLGLGAGYERWEILNKNFDQADSVMGTFDLMEKVYYSKLYDLYSNRFWYSEFTGTDLCNYMDAETLKAKLGGETYDFYMNNYGGVYYTDTLWDGDYRIFGDVSRTGILEPVIRKMTENYRAQNMTDGSLWITVHTAVYDLENLTLDLQVRESQDHLRFTVK